MRTAIYKAEVSTPWGIFLVAIDSIEFGAKFDIATVAYGEFNAPWGLLKVGDVKKSNRRILKKMSPIKNARVGDTYWAWIVRVSS